MQIQITPADFAARSLKVSQQTGQTLTGNKGQVSHNGVTVAYDYDGTSTLSIAILRKPLFISSQAVVRTIYKWFKS